MRLCSQQERLEHLKRICSKKLPLLPQSQLQPAERILADDKHKILYCWMSKVGCTSFKTLFLVAAGMRPRSLVGRNVHKISLLASRNLPLFYRLNYTERAERIASYFKFMNVRHPLERLISVYRDKVLKNDSDLPSLATKLAKHYYPQSAKDSLMNVSARGSYEVASYARTKYPASFAHFMAYLGRKIYPNDHWLSAQQSCHPCSIEWDAILRIETMKSDGAILTSRLAADLKNLSEIPVVHSNQNSTPGNTAFLHTSKILTEYKDVEASAVDKFLEYYRNDMEMFGYSWDKDTLTASCSIQTSDGVCC